MRPHHTKNKGDLGILGVRPGRIQGRTFFRIQVKYRAAVRGVVTAPFSTCWADRHGVHQQRVDKRSIDLYCIYCPDTDCCYYVDPHQFGGTVHLRISPARNSQKRGLRWGADYLEIPTSVRGVQPGLFEDP